MSKLFTSSSPFSQATYSPLRATQANQDDNGPDTTSSGNNAEVSNGHRRSHSSLNTSWQHYHSPPQPGNQQRQFRKRSYSQSSNRTVHSMTDLQQPSLQPQPHLDSFPEGVHDSEGTIPMAMMNAASPTNAMDRPLRRGSAIRSQSLMEESPPREDHFTDKPSSSLPPKYTIEDLQYSEPARLSVDRDEESGLVFEGTEDGQGDGLLMQVKTLSLSQTGLYLKRIKIHAQTTKDLPCSFVNSHLMKRASTLENGKRKNGVPA